MKKLIKNYLKKGFLINLLFIGLFAIISVIYFYPLLSGKQIKQSDIDQSLGCPNKSSITEVSIMKNLSG